MTTILVFILTSTSKDQRGIQETSFPHRVEPTASGHLPQASMLAFSANSQYLRLPSKHCAPSTVEGWLAFEKTRLRNSLQSLRQSFRPRPLPSDPGSTANCRMEMAAVLRGLQGTADGRRPTMSATIKELNRL